jgi:hypothetical protein
MPKIEAAQLTAIIARIIDMRRAQMRVNPSWIATEAMKELDPAHVSPHLVYLGCHLELRQIARGILGQKFEPEVDADKATDDLFPDLQWRYPQARSKKGEEPTYILRDHMSKADKDFNVARLRAEGQAKLDHADALESWWTNRRQRA